MTFEWKLCPKLPNPQWFIPLVLAMLALILLFCSMAHAAEGTASYYSIESTQREGTWQKYGGKMANGRIFDDTEMVCATWGLPFGTRLKVTNLANNKSIVVVVSDRGPNKKLYRQGRIVDLSKGAFERIASLKKGVIKVRVKKL